MEHYKENEICKEWSKVQDAQDWLMWGRSAIGRHCYQECRRAWFNSKYEINYGKTWKLRQNTCTRVVKEYRIFYGTRVLYDYIRLSLGLESFSLKILNKILIHKKNIEKCLFKGKNVVLNGIQCWRKTMDK